MTTQPYRSQTAISLIFMFSAFFSLFLSLGCKGKSAVIAKPQSPPLSSEVMNLIQQGDSSFHDSNLYAWRQAEAFYKKAHDLYPSPEIKKKLLLTRFLIMIRQIDETIPCPSSEAVLQELCTGDSQEKTLCRIAEWFKNGKKPNFFKTDPPIFRGENPTIESYLTLLLFEAIPQADAFSQNGVTDSDARPSLLFLYLNDWKLTQMTPENFEKVYPQFAEGRKIFADFLYNKKKFRYAQRFYQQAIELLPDYTKAHIGLGNLFLYGMEDPDRALKYYIKALETDPASVQALYGKALTLNQTGKYAESNSILEQMLTGNPSHVSWPNNVQETKHYRGEAHYIKASNYHLMQDAAQARSNINTAKGILPDSPEINYLSGILYYQSNDLESARLDLLSAAEKGSYPICDAQFHLGLINTQLKTSQEAASSPAAKSGEQNRRYQGSNRTFENEPAEYRAQRYFIAAASCMEASIGSLVYQIKNLNSLDLDKNDLLLFKSRLENKLLELRRTAAVNIERSLAIIPQDNSAKNKNYSTMLNGILTRVSTP